MRNYAHGGDKYGISMQAKEHLTVLDFSANTNPLGMSEKVMEKTMESIKYSDIYPDPFARELTEKICEKYAKETGGDFPATWVVCGNGAADLIFRTVHALDLKKVLIPAPTFSEYEDALREKQVDVEYFYLNEEDEFQFTEEILNKLKGISNGKTDREANDKIDGIFLCNPNNPVGNVMEPSLLDRVLTEAKKENIYVFLDECFLELTGRTEDLSQVPKLKDFDNLIIFKAFTKTYAMAGLRLGYLLCSNEHITDKIFNTGQPWSVSTPAMAGGVAALDEDEYVEKSVAYIKEQRKNLQEFLEATGFKVYHGVANYIFFYHKNGRKFLEEMKKQGILIRNCENYRGLCEGYMRIAVRTAIENQRFMEKGKEIVKWLNQ